MSISLPRLTSGFASVEAINEALAQIEAALNTQLSTEDATANQMDVPLDMNSERIINLPVAASDHEPVTLGQLRALGEVVLYEPNPHTHVWEDITNKPTSFFPSSHTHLVTQVNGLSEVLSSYSNRIQTVENFPRIFTQSSEPTPEKVGDVWMF